MDSTPNSAGNGTTPRTAGARGAAAGRGSAARRDGRPEQRPSDPALAEIRFLTVAEVATLMRVSRMTVYRMVHSGDLPAVRVGRSFRVPERAVHEYLRSAFNDVG